MGTTHPVLAGVPPCWSCPTHGAFATLSSSFVSLANSAASGGMSVIAAHDYPLACVP